MVEDEDVEEVVVEEDAPDEEDAVAGELGLTNGEVSPLQARSGTYWCCPLRRRLSSTRTVEPSLTGGGLHDISWSKEVDPTVIVTREMAGTAPLVGPDAVEAWMLLTFPWTTVVETTTCA